VDLVFPRVVRPIAAAGHADAVDPQQGPVEDHEDALNIIRNTVDEIDFWAVAQYYDNGG
jgi:hypothetical protein